MLASAIGAAAGSFFLNTTVASLATIGTFACGPFAVALIVGVVAGYALYRLDDHFMLTTRLGQAYDKGLAKLGQVWDELATDANARFDQLARSRMMHDLGQDAHALARKLARQADLVRGELIHLW